MNRLILAVLLFGVTQVIRFTAWRHAAFREHLKKNNGVIPIKTKDNSQGRIFHFADGRMNLLTPSRKQIAKSDVMAAMSCLVEIESWTQVAEAA